MIKSWLKLIGIFALVLGMISIPVSCRVWSFKECKKVGHGTLYCVIYSK